MEGKEKKGMITMVNPSSVCIQFVRLNWFSERVCARYTGSIMYVDGLHN